MADQSLPRAFAAAVDRNPAKTAFVGASGARTYGELTRLAGGVAAAVGAVRPGSAPVLVLAGHDESTVAAMLGVGQAGRTYLVLDPRAPQAFLARVVDRHGAAAILCDVAHARAARLIAGARPVLLLDELAVRPAPATGCDGGLELDPYLPLSVSYTSGSSGTPKAVVHSHRNVVHNARAYGEAIGVTPDDVFLVTSPFSAVAAATPTFTALLAGATLAAFELQDGGARGFAALVAAAGVTVAHLPPAALPLLATLSDEPVSTETPSTDAFERVRLVSLGGDRLLPAQAAAARRLFPAATLLHRYSTSESNWIAGYRVGPHGELPDGTAPVGTPVPWVEVAVVDEDDRPVPAGSVGQLLVSSDYLALGYLDDDALTAQRFVQRLGRRTYRTGDRVRMLADGSLDYAGRADDVVKVRGVLVDLVAVERALLGLDGVESACVVTDAESPTDATPTRLTAFVVGARVRPWQLRARLAERLPTAMVPARIMLLADLPLTSRGKVDREELRRLAERAPRRPYAEPVDELERAIAERFATVLAVDVVGRDDDCFDLGADSLASEELRARLEDDLGLTVDAATLLENPTPAMLAALARARGGQARTRADSRLVTVSHGGAGRTPVVMFSGGGGGHVDGMAQLARALDDRACYVVLPRAFEYRGAPDHTVDAMARSAVTGIASLIPGGPVVLVGHSSGGTVALEAARQLQGTTLTVPLVVLLDTLAWTPTVRQGRRFWPELRWSLREARRTRAARGQGTSAARQAYWALHFPVRRVRRRWLAATAGRLRRPGRRQHAAFDALVKVANRTWLDGPYPGAVHLIRAGSADDDVRGGAYDLRWSQVPGVAVPVSWVRGTHGGMTTGAQAVGTAQEIDTLLVRYGVDIGDARV